MENKQELKKHSAAIHCANTLSLLQRKISNALLYHAYHELPHQAEHEITVKQLCTIIGYKGNNHSAIKDSLRGLLTTLVEWNVTDKDNDCEDWTASTMLASVRIRGSLCCYAYSPRMKELLYSPSMYGKINLIIQSKFQSSYGLALYENCIRYRELPSTKWFEMEIFRKLMGVPNDKYTIFRDFKKRVIDKSVQEVNEYSDLLVQPELHKAGGKVIKIRFKLEVRYKKNKIGSNVIEASHNLKLDDQQELLCKLTQTCCLTSFQASNLLKDFSAEYLLEKIEILINSEPFKKGKIKNVAAYFLQAVNSDFKKPKQSSKVITKMKEELTEIETNKDAELELLKCDLNHWKALFDKTTNEAARISMQKIIKQCEERIKEYLIKNSKECDI